MFGDDDPSQGEVPSPRTTIVGGRPPEDGAALPPVPTGIQQLLRLAAVDPGFRAKLLEQRAAVATAAGIELSASERQILAAVAAAQLEGMIEHLPPPAPERRTFLRETAAAAVLVLGGAALPSCSRGMNADVPARATNRPMENEGGAAPEVPEEDPERQRRRLQAPGGAAPDVPRPKEPAPVPAGVRPDVPPPRPDAGAPKQGASASEGQPLGALLASAQDDAEERPQHNQVTRGIRPHPRPHPDAGAPKKPPRK